MAQLFRRDAGSREPILERAIARLLAPHLAQIGVQLRIRRSDAARPCELRREMVVDDAIEHGAHQLVALRLRQR